MQNGFDQSMGYPIKELGEVEQQDIAILPVLPIMLMKMLGEPVSRKVIALILHAGTVVMNEGAAKDRDQGIVT